MGVKIKERQLITTTKHLNQNKMKTAVEWIAEQLIEGKVRPVEIIAIAKELEKQQIMKAVFDSMGTNIDPNLGRAEQYYNENYNK